jgi:hypothetical protein
MRSHRRKEHENKPENKTPTGSLLVLLAEVAVSLGRFLASGSPRDEKVLSPCFLRAGRCIFEFRSFFFFFFFFFFVTVFAP